jgi:hypothetical protein
MWSDLKMTGVVTVNGWIGTRKAVGGLVENVYFILGWFLIDSLVLQI